MELKGEGELVNNGTRAAQCKNLVLVGTGPCILYFVFYNLS
jgi:hypothetical protein